MFLKSDRLANQFFSCHGSLWFDRFDWIKLNLMIFVNNMYILTKIDHIKLNVSVTTIFKNL